MPHTHTQTHTHSMASAMSILCLTGILFLSSIDAKTLSGKVETEFIILHNNDMHARFEQTSKESGKCTPKDANSNKCYGGFARVAYEVRKYRREAKKGGTPVLYLNAGDTYTGTPWFAIFKDNITAAFLNKLQPDAISLGNHEFDDGVEGLVPFLNKVNFPVLTTNLDLTNAPEIERSKHFAKSTVLMVNDVKIGVIGYLTPDTKYLVVKNPVEFIEEIESINKESARMKAEGIKIFIALGHSGYQKDQAIAANCPDIDIVIGGHTNTFLYNGKQPDAEKIEGPYPTVIKQKSGKHVPVVQAYAYTKYLGKLHVQFDKDGNLIEYDGSPILLNASVPREDDVLQLLEVYRPNITALENDIVGHTKVFLDGSHGVCRTTECNLGNLITDAMVYARVIEDEGGIYWTDAAVAFIGGGGIRSSIEKRSDGAITGNDIVTVLPFGNDLYVTKVSGKTIRKALEHSADLRGTDSNGGFLQMSGVHVVYDFNKEPGKRVRSVEIRCAECSVPKLEPLDENKMYSVVVQAFLLDGGDGHIFDSENGIQPIKLKLNDEKSLVRYISHQNYIYPETEGRIQITERSSATSIRSSLLAVLVAFVLKRIF